MSDHTKAEIAGKIMPLLTWEKKLHEVVDEIAVDYEEMTGRIIKLENELEARGK